MVIRGKAKVTCPACGTANEAELVQSINTVANPADKQRLLTGDLNVLVCSQCGKRSQLAVSLNIRSSCSSIARPAMRSASVSWTDCNSVWRWRAKSARTAG